MKNGKRESAEVIGLPNQECIWTLEKKNLQVFGNRGSRYIIKLVEMKDKMKKITSKEGEMSRNQAL